RSRRGRGPAGCRNPSGRSRDRCRRRPRAPTAAPGQSLPRAALPPPAVPSTRPRDRPDLRLVGQRRHCRCPGSPPRTPRRPGNPRLRARLFRAHLFPAPQRPCGGPVGTPRTLLTCCWNLLRRQPARLRVNVLLLTRAPRRKRTPLLASVLSRVTLISPRYPASTVPGAFTIVTPYRAASPDLGCTNAA